LKCKSSSEQAKLVKKTGFLEKRGFGVVGQWHARYFSLIDQTLFWFKTQQDTDPRGFLKLTDPDVTSVQEKDSIVTIATKTKTYKLRYFDQKDAERSKTEAREWAQVMTKIREQHAEITESYSERRRKIANFQDESATRYALAQSSSGPMGQLRAVSAMKTFPKDQLESILAQFARLIVGSVLEKIKYRRRQKRFVYLSQRLDKLFWAPLDKKDKPKGFISVSQIMSIKPGVAGIESELAFTLITQDKGGSMVHLGFVADSPDQLAFWMGSMKRVVELCQAGFIPLQLADDGVTDKTDA